jgi:CRISPR-associated protein Cmr6
MSNFLLPEKTIESFSNLQAFPHNLNLLISRYLLRCEDLETIKKEVFFYLSSKEAYLNDIISEQFRKLEKEKKKSKEGKRNKLRDELNKTNELIKRLIKIKENEDFKNKSLEVINIINNLRSKISKSTNEALQIANLNMRKFASKKIILQTSSPLIVGLGLTSVLETSMKLHHVYGVPYLPSSAVKGVLRAYKMWELAEWDLEFFRALELAITRVYDKCEKPGKEFKEKLNQLKENDLKSEERLLIKKRNDILTKECEFLTLLSIFGSQTKKGSLITLDAYPEKFNGFDIDIMNSHYPEYYQGDKPPADWQNPNPIKFLVIPEDTTFNFYFLNPYTDLENDIRNALRTFGIGAKTAIGYGAFN